MIRVRLVPTRFSADQGGIERDTPVWRTASPPWTRFEPVFLPLQAYRGVLAVVANHSRRAFAQFGCL